MVIDPVGHIGLHDHQIHRPLRRERRGRWYAAPMILTIDTSPSIERCRYCNLTGWLGKWFCETCNGFGFIELERASILPQS